jgi:hypothetical protein
VFLSISPKKVYDHYGNTAEFHACLVESLKALNDTELLEEHRGELYIARVEHVRMLGFLLHNCLEAPPEADVAFLQEVKDDES